MNRTSAIALLLLTLAAFGLRLFGIGFGLPMVLEDDSMVAYQVDALNDPATEDPTSERNFNWYPLLLARVAAPFAGRALPLAPDAPLEEHLAQAGSLVRRTRTVLAAIACLVVPLTWLLARGLVSRGAALLAAALVATSPLHVSFSQQARPHAASSAIFLAAVLAAVWVRRRRGWLPQLALFLAVAAAVGTLQSGVLVLPTALLAYGLREGEGRRRPGPGALLPLVAAALAVWLFYPFVFEGLIGRRSAEGQEHVFELGGHLIFLDQFNGRGFPITLRTLWSYDPALLVVFLFAATGLARVLGGRPRPAEGWGRRGDLIVALSFALPYFVLFGLYERNYERFVLPLLPYLACAAAWGVAHVARGGARLALASAVALALPACTAVRLVSARAAPHTLERAAAWVEANVEPEARVLLTSKVDLPLLREPAGLTLWGDASPTEREFWWLPWARYQARLDAAGGGTGPGPRWDLRWIPVAPARYMEDAAGFIREQQGDYAVVEVFADNRVHPAGTALTQGFGRVGERLTRLSPDAREDYSEHPFNYQDETSVPPPHFTARALRARGAGPVIEIYRLSRD
jgi:hypothetical protein